MHVTEYYHRYGTERRDGYVAIPELDRYKSSVQQFIRLADLDITLTKPTAFLYVDGFSIAQSESGINLRCPKKYLPAIKTGIAYIVHEWINTFKGKEHLVHVDSISSTCAAGIHALAEADRLIRNDIAKDVIIIGGERTTEDTMRLFRELNIPVTCGDGFVYMKLSRGPMSIYGVDWKYTHQKNPFFFPREVIDTLTPNHPVDYVKLHGTGTQSNTEAEAGLAQLGKVITYKEYIGHTQGISALLETCMVLADDNVKGRIYITANGLGGYYGGFTLNK